MVISHRRDRKNRPLSKNLVADPVTRTVGNLRLILLLGTGHTASNPDQLVGRIDPLPANGGLFLRCRRLSLQNRIGQLGQLPGDFGRIVCPNSILCAAVER